MIVFLVGGESIGLAPTVIESNGQTGFEFNVVNGQSGQVPGERVQVLEPKLRKQVRLFHTRHQR